MLSEGILSDLDSKQNMDQDEKQLLSLGYKQSLHRTYKSFDNFSAGFVSLYFIGGVRMVFTTSLSSGGPQAFWITYIVSFFFMSITAAVMAESCSALPVSGSLYLWASEYAKPKYARLVGFVVAWWSVSAWTTFIAGNTQSAANFILSELAVFHVNFPTSTTFFKFRIVQWFLSEVLLVFSVSFNYLKPRLFKYVLRISSLVIILDFFLNVIWLPIGVSKTYGFQNISFFIKTYNGTGAVPVWNWCLSFLSTASLVVGFDAPGHIAEETKNASLNAARNVFTSAFLTGLLGLPCVFLFLFCSPKLNDLFSLDAPQPFVQLYVMALGKKVHIVLNFFAVFGHILNTTMAILVSSRLVYSIARDGVLFLSNWASKVDAECQPRNSVTLIWISSSIILCIIPFSQVAFTSFISAMTLPTVSANLLVLRLSCKTDKHLQVKWSLGIVSRPFQVIAFVWCVFVMIVLSSPYQFPLSSLTFNYAPVMLVIITCCSLLMWWKTPKDAWLVRNGLGLGDEKDISVKGLEIVRQCYKVYLEAYTSVLGVNKEKLEEFYGCSLVIANREMIELNSDVLLHDAYEADVALLVVGDPLSATTHVDLLLRARKMGISTQIVYNASIMNAIGVVGLQLYNFGQTVSLVFFTETWKPDSIYFRIKENRDLGLHTLILLDLCVQEPSYESLIKGKKIYVPPRYMSISKAIEQLLELESLCNEKVYDESTLAVGVARVGSSSERIVAGSLKQLSSVDFGPPLHSLVLFGSRIHILEIEYVRAYALDIDAFDSLVKQQFPSVNRMQ
ncbi:hypothetical protein PORY_000636 [Pneumocystis oryctolagi]|uniref:Uncharacterized protein n=1 Tax=Pneumocystis oryctolagi TaxID=42067 RepID=A0ACB7CDT5_9ASCO|nr:hypothetical protein PORY_000636 [Pneumocystis oryctolagi]